MVGRILAGPASRPWNNEGAPEAITSVAARVHIGTNRPIEFVDLTPRVEAFVLTAGLVTGWINVQTRHTTAGLLVNELEPLLLGDLETLLERAAPRGAGYAHDELHRRNDVPPDERPNGHAHAKAALLPSSATLNVVGGSLQLGRWQRVLLVELDGPRPREISLVAVGTRGRQ
jgi:secondary thiamine-phosphate synthase enzyme